MIESLIEILAGGCMVLLVVAVLAYVGGMAWAMVWVTLHGRLPLGFVLVVVGFHAAMLLDPVNNMVHLAVACAAMVMGAAVSDEGRRWLREAGGREGRAGRRLNRAVARYFGACGRYSEELRRQFGNDAGDSRDGHRQEEWDEGTRAASEALRTARDEYDAAQDAYDRAEKRRKS
jgi:hypothetical protein